MLLKDSNKEF